MGKWIIVLTVVGTTLLSSFIGCDSKSPSQPQNQNETITASFTPTNTVTQTITSTPGITPTMIPVTIVASTQYPATSAPSYSADYLWACCPGGSVSLGTSANNQATTVVLIPKNQYAYIQVNENYSLPQTFTLTGILELTVTQPNVSPMTSYGVAVTNGGVNVEDDAQIDVYAGSSSVSVK